MRCLYLTHPVGNAVQLQNVVRADSIRIHQTALSEMSLLLRRTEARVIVVDLAFAGEPWPRLLPELSSQAPQCSLVFAATELHAEPWEDTVWAGAFGLIRIPFRRDEAVPVLRGADAFARKHLSPQACNQRIRSVLSLVEQQFRGGGAA